MVVTSMVAALHATFTTIPKAILPFSSLLLLPALGWGSSVTAVGESHWVNGLVEWDRQVSFHLEVFPGLTCHMKADYDPNNRRECGEKEQAGTPSAVE